MNHDGFVQTSASNSYRNIINISSDQMTSEQAMNNVTILDQTPVNVSSRQSLPMQPIQNTNLGQNFIIASSHQSFSAQLQHGSNLDSRPANQITLLAEQLAPNASHTLQALYALPRIRSIDTRPNRTLDLSRAVNQEAALCQTRGQIAINPCACCAKKAGIFTECIVVPGRLNGTCGNCHHQGRDSRCSFTPSKLCPPPRDSDVQ